MCNLARHRNMATLTIWSPAKWMPQIPGQMDGPNACPTLNVLNFSWTTYRGFSWATSRDDLAFYRNMATLTIWFPAKWMPPCRIAWHTDMATLTIWFTAKWMPQIPGQMDAPNACPTLNVLNLSQATCRGFSWTTSRGDLAWHRNMATLTIWFLANMDAPNAYPTLNVLKWFLNYLYRWPMHDIATWQLSLSAIWFLATWMLLW